MRTQLCQSEIKELISKIESELGIKDIVTKKDNVAVEDNPMTADAAKANRLIKVNNKTMFFYYNGKICPSLKTLISFSSRYGDKYADWLKETKIRTIIVDKGAVKFVVNGADIMRPGITSIDDGIVKDSFVIIIDQEHKKPLAIGTALLSSEDIRNSTHGKVIKNIHYVGDELWKHS